MEKYQDYVIKDGEFIGQFEKMYQRFDDPWGQKKEVNRSYSRWDTVLSIKNYNIRSFLEIGCGLGQFSNFLVTQLPYLRQRGVDISQTAISKAKIQYPSLIFDVGNITDYAKRSEWEGYDCIILSEIMWYILNDLEYIFDIFGKEYSGYLIINVNFPDN